MASGSAEVGVAAAPVVAGTASPGAAPISDRRCATSALGVGWSNSRVVGSGSPVLARSRLRRSTAVMESNPSCLKARSMSMPVPAGCPSTSAVSSRTSAASALVRWSGASAAMRRTNAGSWCASGSSGCAAGSSTPDSSGLGRRAVNSGAKRVQSTSATTTAVSSWSRARRNPARARSGGIASTPRCRRSSSQLAAMPAPAHAPHAIDVAGRPAARRCWASASR